MKAYQIVCVGDERSERYAELSRESYQPAIDAGYISEIITFPAITPEHPDFEEILAKYDWRPSLATLDTNSGKPISDHSPTEKAGMCSHWELMRRQGESDERFLIIEHDSYLIPEHLELFGKLLDIIQKENVCYANIGLFMGCYTMNKHCAGWMYDLLYRCKFWINGGPYGVMERLFKNYTEHYLRKRNYLDIDPTVIHPWHECDTLGMGRKIIHFYNDNDRHHRSNPWRTPTTQMVSKELKVTQDHHRYKQKHLEKPWTRHSYMHIID
jgi:hypothetical protein